MLRSLKDLEGYAVSATDGDIGSVEDFLLDDERWGVRYLVVRTAHGFFDARSVLISPISFREAEWSTKRFHVALTREKVKDSPGIDVHQPVSRQHERDYFAYYGYPYYWGFAGLWGMGRYPGLLADRGWSGAPTVQTGDAHLRSASEVRGYHVQGTDERIGHVADFIVDDETWQARYLVIDTGNWWPGKKVLVAPHWAKSISWERRTVHVDMSRESIKSSPAWSPIAGVNRQYEAELYEHHGRPVYWDNLARPAVTPPAIARSVAQRR